MPNKPVKTTYQTLLNDIATIHDQAMKDLSAAVDSILKAAYWEIGKRIVEVEQKGELHAQYGSHLLEKLSEDLTAANRKGFSVSNLKNMRQVYTAFSIRQLTGELTWTHYVALSAIKDEKVRNAFAKKATAKRWNVEKLQETLVHDKVALIHPHDDGKKSLPLKAKENSKILRLAVKRGVLNTYSVVAFAVPGKEAVLRADCGFSIYYRLKIPKDMLLKEGDVIAVAAGAGETWEKDYKVKRLGTVSDKHLKSVLYTYAARVIKVIDADTMTVEADLGFGIFSKQKLRLRLIDAPEVSTPAGKKAKAYVLNLFKSIACVVIKTYSTDIYDRYLVDVFYLPPGIPGCDDPQRIASEGKYLNQELIDKGFAELWQKPDLDELAFLN